MTYTASQVFTYVVLALMLGIGLGGLLAMFFEDALRGPIMRAYDDWIEAPAGDEGPFRRE